MPQPSLQLEGRTLSMLQSQVLDGQQQSQGCAYNNDRGRESKREFTEEKSTNLVEMSCKFLCVLSGTGLPVKLAILVDSVMQQSLLMALIVTGLAALVFSMGMPTLPAYLTIILILGPSLLKLGMPLLVAHMFVFYFGVASTITPPVCIAAYAAAAIAGAGPLHTGFTAFRIGLALFIVLFAFAYPLKIPEVLLRFALTVLLVIWPSVHWAAFAVALVLIRFNQLRFRQAVAVTT